MVLQSKKMRLTEEYTADIEGRFKYASIFVAVLLIIVLGRLYYLQVIKGSFYHFFSTENSIKPMVIRAPRGMIFDRRGQILVDNRPSFNIIITPQYVVDPVSTLNALSKLLGVPKEELDVVWAKRKTQPSYQPLVVKKDVSLADVSLVRANKNPWFDARDPYDLRGVDVEVNYQRVYPGANIATHLLGYLREIDPERLKKYESKYPDKYRVGDMVGIRGLEEQWDVWLRGSDGYEEHVVDAVGREVDYKGIASELEKREPISGDSLRLTIDKDLQERAKEMFGEKKGALVAIDVRTGGLLAMYSSPSYDLNLLAGPEGDEYWKFISEHPDKYLLNRAIQGGYPPGSTYKIVNAVAALSEGVVKPDETVSCHGALVFGGRPYHCWAKGGHGPTSIHRAIVSSCDVFFYTMGLRLGVDRLAKYANMFMLGKKTGVPLADEKPGLIPTSEWKLKRFGVPWQKGEDLSIAVGQGYDVVTPMQNAMLATLVSNGGKKVDLHIVDEAYDALGKATYSWKAPQTEERIAIDPSVLDIVKKAMTGVVAEVGGTAHRLSTYTVSMGGKTGTAQVVQLDGNAVCTGERCKDHAWFIGFSPAEKPEIAVGCVVEHGGFGASAAAPIVGAVMQKYHDIEYGTEEESKVTAATDKKL